MRFLSVLAVVLALTALGAATTAAQSPSPTASSTPTMWATPSPSPTTAPTSTLTVTPTPPVTSVPQFPSSPQYLRAWPGVDEDTWYVYASGFTPRTDWIIGEVLCPGLPCDSLGSAVNDHVKEDGTMTFYVRLPRADDPARPRLLAAVEYQASGPLPEPVSVTVPAGAPSITVAGHNPGVGTGYPAGTRTGIAAVDQVIALVEVHDTAAIRARLVLKSGTTVSGEPVRGVASWQCGPYIQQEGNLDQVFEYPGGPLYAVFRVPADPALPLRYEGASYGIAFYDGGAGIPLGGLILVSDTGQIVGTEIRCGTTPGFHVHNFTDFVLAPFAGPPPATATTAPRPPGTGSGNDVVPAPWGTSTGLGLAAAGLLMLVSSMTTAVVAVRRRR
ncbi:MAG: hypothetical protein IT303_07865 [Dehalococcoidia bacterium]|nr:hypothetical protein [Dehalococcoidia bacterium]